MIHMRGIYIAGAFLVLASCVLAGCVGSSQSARFYTLSSASPVEAARTSGMAEPVLVAVGPLRIPEYLDRPQIITRTGQNELVLSEFQRWGGSLESELKRVITDNVGKRLGPDYAVVNWPSVGIGNLQFAYRVSIDILQFEKITEHDVALKAQWGVMKKDSSEQLLVRSSSINEPISGPDYDALVAAMSRAAAKLSGEIAAAVSTLPRHAAK